MRSFVCDLATVVEILINEYDDKKQYTFWKISEVGTIDILLLWSCECNQVGCKKYWKSWIWSWIVKACVCGDREEIGGVGGDL